MMKFVIAGPCAMESYDLVMTVAEELKRIQEKLSIDIVFKSSFDKANRTDGNSFKICCQINSHNEMNLFYVFHKRNE